MNIVKKEIFKIIACFTYGTLGCFYLHQLTSMSVVFSSVVTILLYCLLSLLISNNNQLMEASIYSGTFVGMSAASVLDDFWVLLVASIVGGITVYALKDKFLGHGGKLGTIAFLTVFFIRSFNGGWTWP